MGDCRPIRVCFLIDRLGLGGTETQLLALIRYLDRSRVQPYLVLLDGEDEGSRSLTPEDCPVLKLGVTKLIHVRALQSLQQFRRFLRYEKIDVIQMYFPDSTYFGVLAGNLAGVDRIVRTRNNSNYWMTRTHRWLGRLVNRMVAVTVCNSDAGRRAILTDERPNPNDVIVIENGVDFEKFVGILPPSPVRQSEYPHRVGMVANLRSVKRHDVFLRAAARVARGHPDVEFALAGDGPEQGNLERLAHELGIADQVLFFGRVTNVPSFLAQLDVAVLSSQSEGMSNTLLEYMAAARPIVATDVGSASLLIDNGVHGRLISPNDEIALATGITETLADRSRARSMALAARQRVIEHYDRRKVVERFAILYETLMQANSYGWRGKSFV